ncbi:unnamed protein product [Rodentolepis nana]|uniref:Cmyb_C domain-containing protein n=1 Tax=Rodentolepis nana TaxID=102285 RepID=A0A0R3TYT6_RODNA|nr:unnamed protein product [Rodentolepis nana]
MSNLSMISFLNPSSWVLVPSGEISKPKVSETIKLFERNIAAEETSGTKPVAISSREENPTCFNERRPAGAVAMYTNQGPQLLREMKDRLRTKYGISYIEPKPSIQEPLSPSLLQDSSILSRLDLSPEEVQNLAPLPTNLDSDFSHILPSVLKGRPRRAGRPPTIRNNLTYSERSSNTTDV